MDKIFTEHTKERLDAITIKKDFNPDLIDQLDISNQNEITDGSAGFDRSPRIG